MGTAAFQRLRNVRQLGLAHLVFPGADFSRFAHSLGVCQTTGRLLERLRDLEAVADHEIPLYRLCGLLHDIGHYPYSHAFETPLANHYRPLVIPFLDHEAMSAAIIENDPQLVKILGDAGIDPKAISAVIMHESESPLSKLVSSDLDADRIDYLLRTAHHGGLPYGSVDIAYLIGQICVDKDGRVCVDPRALRTVDHLLLSRYFDYQQMVFHKTVVGLELVLKDLIGELLARGMDCSRAALETKIRAGEWAAFDDPYLMGKIRELHSTTTDAAVRLKTTAILNRIPPRLIVKRHYIAKSDDSSTEARFRADLRNAEAAKKLIANKLGIPETACYLWSDRQTLTKIGANVPVEKATEAQVKGREEIARIYDPVTKDSRPIVNVESSLMSVLSDNAAYSIRLYALVPDLDRATREEVAAHVRANVHVVWN